MQTINISKKRFESLKKYQIPNYVYNTEGTIYELPIKNKWETQIKLLKRLYLTNGIVFGNKLQTINSLIDSKEQIGIEEIVFPEKIAVVDSQIVGFTMPLIKSINLKTAFMSDIPIQTKISYLKQIGALLERMRLVREYSGIQEFYLNDLHESNFIVDENGIVRAIDMDSCKINSNQIFSSKYLSSKSFINEICKYHKNDREENKYRKYSTDSSGIFIPDENTDLYCYIIVILNFLYGDNVVNFTIEEFYEYLEYLATIGVPLELLKYFEKITSNSQNDNPYELLDCLTPFVGRSNHKVYTYIKNKSSKYH